MIFHQFVSQHQDAVQIILYAFVITSLWFAELFFTTGISTLKAKWQHNRVNLLFIGTALPIQLLLTIIVLIILSWTNLHHWG